MSCFVSYIGAAGGGGPVYPPPGTSTELIPTTNSGGRAAYGHSIAVSRDTSTIAVGDPSANSGKGIVWVFRDPDLDGTWTEDGYLNPSDTVGFGRCLALNADGTKLFGAQDGSASVDPIVKAYARSGSWAFSANLPYPPNIGVSSSATQKAPFSSMACDDSGVRVVAGDPAIFSPGADYFTIWGAEDNAGAVYVWRDSGGWSIELAYEEVFDLPGNGGDDFANRATGFNVHIDGSGETIVVDHHFYSTIEFIVRSGTTWSQQQMSYVTDFSSLFGSDPGGLFYKPLLTQDGNTCVVINQNGQNNACLSRSGSVWSGVSKFNSSATALLLNGITQSQVGAINSDATKLVIGSAQETVSGTSSAGKILTFNGSAGSFTETTSYTNPSGNAANARWGFASGVDGDAILMAVGARGASPGGRAWVRYL